MREQVGMTINEAATLHCTDRTTVSNTESARSGVSSDRVRVWAATTAAWKRRTSTRLCGGRHSRTKPVRREGQGTRAIDLWLRRDGVFETDVALHLTPAEAELLHAQLCYALDDVTAALIVPEAKRPECRKGGTTRRR
jgi:hypothetical protein